MRADDHLDHDFYDNPRKNQRFHYFAAGPKSSEPLNQAAADLYKENTFKFNKKAFHVFRGY